MKIFRSALKKIILLQSLMLSFLSYSCGSSTLFIEEVRLARPVGIEIQRQSGTTFLLRYYIQNKEETFDGYNLYISRTPISEGEIYSTLSAFSRDGGLPTFRHNGEQCDLVNPEEVILEYYADAITRFERNIRYYFRMTAHSTEGLISQPSNEVNDIAQD